MKLDRHIDRQFLSACDLSAAVTQGWRRGGPGEHFPFSVRRSAAKPGSKARVSDGLQSGGLLSRGESAGGKASASGLESLPHRASTGSRPSVPHPLRHRSTATRCPCSRSLRLMTPGPGPPRSASYSLWQASRPRRDIMVSFWQVLIWPTTGSTACARNL